VGLAVSPDGAHVYVPDYGSGQVSVIDTATAAVTATIQVGADPHSAAVSPDGSTVYVTDAGSGTVSVINTATETLSSTFSVGPAPHGIALAVAPTGGSAYVADFGASSVSAVSLASDTVTATIGVGTNPVYLAVSTIKPLPTTLHAGTAQLTLLPLGEANLNATLTTNGTPVAGQTITFTDNNGEFLCSAKTDAHGHAACNTAPGLLDSVSVLLGGYRASFAGSTYYLPSCAHGDTALL
jgi:YVTN family beta-propeller protein